MSTVLENATGKLIEAATKAGQDIATFVQTQAPDVFRQLVIAKEISSICDCLGWGMGTVLAAILSYKSYKRTKDDEVWWLGTIILSVTAFVFFCAAESSFTKFITCLVAPKAVIFHELKP